MESLPIHIANKGGCMSPPTPWSLPNNPQIPFLTPPPSPIRYAPPPVNCVPSQFSQYSPPPSATVQGIPNASNMHKLIPSSVPQFPPPPYPPPGVNYDILQGPTTYLNSSIDSKLPPQEFFNSTKWPYPPPYPVPRLPTNMINNGEWTDTRSVNSSCPQSAFSPPTSPFEYNSFVSLTNNANDSTSSNIPCPETSCYGQSSYSLTNISPIPFKCCNSNCACDSSNNIVPEQSFLPGHHSSSPFDAASPNLYEYNSHLGYNSPNTHYPQIPAYSRPNKQAPVQISVYDLHVLLLSPPPPPPLQLPLPSSYIDENVPAFSQQFPLSIDGSFAPNGTSTDQRTLSQQSSILLPQQHIFPLSCRNMNELVLSRVPSIYQNLHVLHPQLRSILTMPGMSDQSLSQVTLFNSRPNLHFPIEPITPISVRSMDEQTPLQVTVFQPNSCIASNLVRPIVPLPAVRRMDDQTISQVTLFHPNSFATSHSLVPTLDVSNMNEHAQMHFPLFDQQYFPSLPFQQLATQHHNPVSVMNEQIIQETSNDPYSGLNSMPYDSPLQERTPHILNVNNNDISRLAEEVSFDANSCFQSPSSQESPLEYLPSTDSMGKKISTPRGLFNQNSVFPPTSSPLTSSVVTVDSPESIEYLPPLDSTDEEVSSQRDKFDQNAVFPPTSSQVTSTVLTIESANGQETLQITTYDLYLLLLPPPPPPPYPPPSPPSTPTPPSSSTPTAESSESTLLTSDEDQLLSPSPSFATSSEDQVETQSPSFEAQIPDFLMHFVPTEQPILPMAVLNNTTERTFLPSSLSGFHSSLEMTSPMLAVNCMKECTPQQTLEIDPNSSFIPPSTFPIPPEPIYMPPAINLNQNTNSQMPLYSTTKLHPTQSFHPSELNSQSNVYPTPQFSNELHPSLPVMPLIEPKLPMLVVNTPDGWTLFWKPFRLPPPPLGPSAIAPINIADNCVLPPFNMDRLCTPPTSSKPMLVGNMAGGLAAPPFVPKFGCLPHQLPITPARLIHLQARVPVYYSSSVEKNGTETSNTKIVLGA